ncbi:phage terminase large subunit family protein [candidate division WOR-3 bacterium]|nr:phage terminase large subunit family protein [candidate division WOR-3 bacterium]
MKIVEWIKDCEIRTNKNAPLEFRDHGFLWDYLIDPAQRIVIRKCTQVGVSFTTLLKVLYHGCQKNISIIYTLPTATDVKDFVLSKVDPLIAMSSGLRDKVSKDPFSRRQVFSSVLKRIDNSHYFFRGSWSQTRAQTIDADILVVDELDFQKPDVRKMYEERLEGAKSLDIIYWIGTPTLPNYGISNLWDESDQREWHIECPACKERQTLQWPVNVSFQKKTFVCRHCRKDLSDDDRRKGLWIPRNPGREIHGYSFNRLMAPWIKAEKLIKAFHSEKPKHFYNFSLGIPYLEKTMQFNLADFKAALMSQTDFQNYKRSKVCLGIDQGNNFHMIIGFANPEQSVVTKAIMFHNARDFEKAIGILKPDAICMDMFPDQHFAAKLQEKFKDIRFYLINQRSWNIARKSKGFKEIDNKTKIINLERTESLDSMYDRIRNGSVKFYELMTGGDQLLTHLKNLVPDFQDRFGRKQKVYQTISMDDFAHALNYFVTASEVIFPKQMAPISIVGSPTSSAVRPSVGSPDWIRADYEKNLRKILGSKDTIVIPPKPY